MLPIIEKALKLAYRYRQSKGCFP